MTLTILRSPPERSLATAIPSPAEMEVDECPVPKASCGLSLLLGKPDSPSRWRIVENRSRRPVRILWA